MKKVALFFACDENKKNRPRNCGRCAVNICVWRPRNRVRGDILLLLLLRGALFRSGEVVLHEDFEFFVFDFVHG